MDIANITGWIGTILFMVGVYQIGVKKISGFYINIGANFMYIIQAIIMNNQSLHVLSWILLVLNIKGIYEWNKKSIIKKDTWR